MTKYFAIITLILFTACNGGNDKPDYVDDSIKPKPTPNIAFSIIAEYPHDTSAYTQGLEFYNGKLYESTGDYRNSSVRITDYKTGKVEKKHSMGTDSVFGEGITIFNGKLYQLTWESHIVYVYDINNLDKPVKTFNWPYEGWGLTHNATDLIVSDGTSKLYFVNPEDFRVKSTRRVTERGSEVMYLNELEYVAGFIYANVYQSDYLVKIDPESGFVVGKIDLPNLKRDFFADKITDRTDYLNGIAYDSTTNKFLITGKRWPKMFELKFN